MYQFLKMSWWCRIPLQFCVRVPHIGEMTLCWARDGRPDTAVVSAQLLAVLVMLVQKLSNDLCVFKSWSHPFNRLRKMEKKKNL